MKYDLTIFRQKRLFVGMALLPLGLMGSIFLGIELGGFAFVIMLMILFFLLLGYFAIGHLTVTIHNGELLFQWKKKYFFNFRDIPPVSFSDIHTIVLDNGQFLRKIITMDRTIFINNSKINAKDAAKFIHQLSIAAKKYDIKTVDSWDVPAKKGFAETLYRINIAILILAGTVVFTFISIKGFQSRHLPLIFLLFPQMILAGIQMKQKIDKNKL